MALLMLMVKNGTQQNRNTPYTTHTIHIISSSSPYGIDIGIVLYFELHSKFALRPYHVWYGLSRHGRHMVDIQTPTAEIQRGKKKKEEEEEEESG